LNRKLIFWFALSLILLFSACFRQKEKTTYNDESDFSVVVVGGGESVSILRYTGTQRIVNIPPKIDGKAVISISEMAFWNCSITFVTIPDSVNIIGDSAFVDCTYLRSVTIGKGVLEISWSAFLNCRSLTSINIDENNKKYSSDNGILYNKNKTYLYKYPIIKTGITFNIPDSVIGIGKDAFKNCKTFKVVNIPDGVTSIGDGAFDGCEYLESLIIPNGVTYIGDSAFEFCRRLKSVTIPNSVTKIGHRAFIDCTILENVILPNSLISIGDRAFSFCEKLENIIIPNNVTELGESAFHYCDNLVSLIIPNIGSGVTSIGGWAFYNCTSLASVTCLAATPPVMGNFLVFLDILQYILPNLVIKVPAASVAAYKAAGHWSSYASRIVAIEEGE